MPKYYKIVAQKFTKCLNFTIFAGKVFFWGASTFPTPTIKVITVDDFT